MLAGAIILCTPKFAFGTAVRRPVAAGRRILIALLPTTSATRASATAAVGWERKTTP